MKRPASANTSLAKRRSPRVDEALGEATNRPASGKTSLAEWWSPRVDEAVGGRRSDKLGEARREPDGGALKSAGRRRAMLAQTRR